MKKKKKHTQNHRQVEKQDDSLTLKDQLSEDIFSKLQAAKTALSEEQKKKEEEEHARKLFEKKQREKNMSFEELLEQYGDKGSKF